MCPLFFSKYVPFSCNPLRVRRAGFDFYLSTSYRWAVCLVVPLFLYLFLLAFLPFGVSNYNPYHEYTGEFLLEIANFMALSLALMVVAEFVFKPRLLRKADLPGILLWSAGLLVLLGLGNFLLYNWLGNWHDFTLGSALSFMVNVSSIILFPLIGVFFYFRYLSISRRLQQMQVSWAASAEPERMLRFTGQGANEVFSVAETDFCYAQAQDNYVALYYLRQGQLRKELLRATLAELLEQPGMDGLVRCHRSFAVNLRQVQSYSGGHPLQLYLKDVPEPIRVSRSYREAVLAQLQSGVASS